jgi:hypothetical protein
MQGKKYSLYMIGGNVNYSHNGNKNGGPIKIEK